MENIGGAVKLLNTTDGQPRIWSSGNIQKPSGGYVSYASLGIPASDLTHIRVRVKTEAEGQTMVVQAEYLDTSTNQTTMKRYSVNYTGGTGGYEEVLFDVSSDSAELGENVILDRLCVYPFGTQANEELKNEAAYIGSVQFLEELQDGEEGPLKILVIGNSITQHSPNASLGWYGNWGMAATSPDKDYIHLLRAKVQEANDNVELYGVNISEFEKYFYDLDLAGGNYARYADYDADIIISTIGANVKNGANEGDDSFENDYTFTKEKYKAILDYFNPDGDAQIIVGNMPLTSAENEAVLSEAADAYGYPYVDMSDLTDAQYKGQADALKEAFGVDAINQGVLNHPGDAGMAAIADELWTVLESYVKANLGLK